MRKSLVAAVALLASTLNAQSSFTIEQVMSAPFASDLTAATRANTIAWLVATKGVRNVWVATGPAWTARQVTSYTNDDGQELAELHVTSDGRALVFVRGGEA